MEQNIQESNSLPAATHASRSVMPGSAKARKMTATSGRKCLELLNKQDPLLLSLKTLLVTSQWDSTMCFLAWKPRATPQGRLLFQLVPSVPRIDGIECGLLPTPRASDGMKNKLQTHLAPDHNHRGRLEDFVAKHETTPGYLNPEWIEWLMGYPIGWTELAQSETQ